MLDIHDMTTGYWDYFNLSLFSSSWKNVKAFFLERWLKFDFPKMYKRVRKEGEKQWNKLYNKKTDKMAKDII